MRRVSFLAELLFFVFTDTATAEIYTLSLHDALPIPCVGVTASVSGDPGTGVIKCAGATSRARARTSSSSADTSDRKSTRLNSSHANISYAVFCLKKKKRLSGATLSSLLSALRHWIGS